MKKFLIFFLLPVCIFPLSTSPGDFPIAKNLSRGEYKMGIRFQKAGGILFSIDAAILDVLSIGVRYGGIGIVGDGEINLYPSPGVNISYLLLEESTFLPSFVLGIETQGFEEYIEADKRYFIKSRGIYLVTTKTLPIFSGFLITGGINKTFETQDEKNGVDVFCSAILKFSPEFSIFSEYAFAFNDPLHKKGIFNVGVAFNIEDQFYFSFIFRDLFGNNFIRTFYVGYKGYL